MLEERARVLSVEGAVAWVEASRTQGCAKCEAGEGCGGGVLAKLVKRSPSRLQVISDLQDVSIGDEVVIGLDERALLHSSLAAYLLPIAGLFAGASIGEFLLQASDLVVAALGMLGLAIGFMGLRRFSRHSSKDSRYQPVILRRINHVASGCQVYVANKDQGLKE